MKKIIIQTLVVVSSLAVTSCGKDVKSPTVSKPAPAAKPTSSTVTQTSDQTTNQSGNNHTCGSGQSTTTSTETYNSSSGGTGY